MNKLVLAATAVALLTLAVPSGAGATSPWQHGPARVWVPGHWEKIDHGRQRVWVPGQWVVRTAPPPHRHDYRDDRRHWNDGRHGDHRSSYGHEPRGHWDWRYGRQVWIPHSWR